MAINIYIVLFSTILIFTMEVDKLLKSLYYDLKSPIAYTSRANVYKAARELLPTITKDEVEKWFRKQTTATLHKPVRYNFERNRTFVKGMNEQFQCDLCDMSKFEEHNDGNTFLLSCIDCFSRYGWVKPVKNKTGKEIARALKEILDEQLCKRIQTDKGKEFLNKNVHALLNGLNIELWTSENEDIKASIVERFNRSMKGRMYKYFTAVNTFRYMDVLAELVHGYNNTKHRSIGMTPAEVTIENQVLVRQKLYGMISPQSKEKYKYKIGNHVRITKKRNVFTRGYHPGWTTEIFLVTGRRNDLGIRPLYTVEDLNGEEVKGTFYAQELQLAELPDDHLVERVIRKKKQRGRTLYLVQWQGWPNSFNSWVTEEDLHYV